MFPRRRAMIGPDGRQGVRRTVDAVRRGKDALTSAVPGPRRPGTPLAQALMSFEQSLGAARAHMLEWRTRETEPLWKRCSDALAESARRAERLRLEAPALDFEGLVMVLKDVIEPLDEIDEADRLVRGRLSQ